MFAARWTKQKDLGQLTAKHQRKGQGKGNTQCQGDFPRETTLSLILHLTTVPWRTGEGAKTWIPQGEGQSCIGLSCPRVHIQTQGEIETHPSRSWRPSASTVWSSVHLHLSLDEDRGAISGPWVDFWPAVLLG